MTEESALLFCSKRGPTSRAIDNVKKKKGQATQHFKKLAVKTDQDYSGTGALVGNGEGAPAQPVAGAKAPPLTLKLK